MASDARRDEHQNRGQRRPRHWDLVVARLPNRRRRQAALQILGVYDEHYRRVHGEWKIAGSDKSNAPAAGSATSTTSTAEYGSTAPAPRGQQHRLQDHCPARIVEPIYHRDVYGIVISAILVAISWLSERAGSAVQ